MENSKSKELLKKVYDHLDGIDVTKLSMKELLDFLEVVQKCQFLESFGKVPDLAIGGFGGTIPKMLDNKGNETAAEK